MEDGKLQWHPAFAAALRIELEDEADHLDIEEEHMLSKKPMQIDVLVVKKETNKPLKKNIGRIFRTYNIIEYKAPDDYVSINDFYKVLGYTFFYQSDTERVMEIDPDELTITFVCSHYPQNLIKHLQIKYGVGVEKQGDGIYYITNNYFPIQIVIVKQLSKKENYWLQSLRSDLEQGEEIRQLLRRYEEKKKSKLHQAVMNLIVRANWEKMEEEKKVCEALMELFAEEFRESERKGLERGIEKGIEKGIQNLIETCCEIHFPKKDTTDKLMEKYMLSSEAAEEYMVKYWKG